MSFWQGRSSGPRRISCASNRVVLRPTLEPLDARILLHASPIGHANVGDEPLVEAIAPQYKMHHPPRIQLGNAPLAGTPDDNGLDQIELLWQTINMDEDAVDRFVVKYRADGDADWTEANIQDPFDTQTETRKIFSVQMDQLLWNTQYQYLVEHWTDQNLVNSYQATFQTRLEPGSNEPFSFAAYGDSSTYGSVEPFRAVQSEINRLDLDFAVLLGDNIYRSGSYLHSDARFQAELNPEAVEWNRSHVDYFAVGNNDVRTDDGNPSTRLFSVPRPIAGVNAYAQPADHVKPGFGYSFDYGNAHFVTIDSNVVDTFFGDRDQLVRDMIEYVEADLAASNAQWKIVHVHHPFIGTEKGQRPDNLFFKDVVTRLNRVDADLFLAGHSHTFSWTYPLQGFNDDDNNQIIDVNEVQFAGDSDSVFEKGDGLVQVVSGVGGGSLRHAVYDEPFFAGKYSLSPETGPLEHGFAKIDVNGNELTLSYISGNTGEIIGDNDLDGVADDDEPWFAQFKIVGSSSNPDVNLDGTLDAKDIDVMHENIRNGVEVESLDFNQDGKVSQCDTSVLLTNFFNSGYGDSNLDGIFDSSDLVLVFQANQYEDDLALNSGWAQGDWDGDGDFTTRDLVFVFQLGTYQM